jgi:PPOX class probable F420-dependent enzyme
MPRRDRHRDDQYYALKTFRRDGSWVSTPIWLAPASDRLYCYTPSRSWKVRRIRRDPKVEIAPSTFNGTPVGPWQGGTARVLADTEMPVAKRAMTAKYGNQFRWFTIVTLLGRLRRHGGRAVALEITLISKRVPFA